MLDILKILFLKVNSENIEIHEYILKCSEMIKTDYGNGRIILTSKRLVYKFISNPFLFQNIYIFVQNTFSTRRIKEMFRSWKVI